MGGMDLTPENTVTGTDGTSGLTNEAEVNDAKELVISSKHYTDMLELLGGILNELKIANLHNEKTTDVEYKEEDIEEY